MCLGSLGKEPSLRKVKTHQCTALLKVLLTFAMPKDLPESEHTF